MNRSKNDSLAHSIRARILAARDDQLWTYADFDDVDPSNMNRYALSATLSRLARNGHLVRVRRGVYYRPKVGVFGPTNPDPTALAQAVLRAGGDRPVSTGVSVYNRLGLTTQVSNAVAVATTRRVPSTLLRKNGVRLFTVRRPLGAQKGITSAERAALDALRDVDQIPGSTPADVISRMAALIRSGDLNFVRLAKFARAEPPRVRALLGAIGNALRDSGSVKRVPQYVLDHLRGSLNALTSFAVPGVGDVLPASTVSAWRIK